MKVSARRGICRLHWVSDLLNLEATDWDRNKLLRFFNRADREAILKIKIPVRIVDDFVAWQGEQSGIFTVRSAYNLAMKLLNLDSETASSSAPTGERESYGPRLNNFARTLEVESRCTICGVATENSFHTTVSCRAARDLREATRQHWSLSNQDQWCYSGPDWLLLLLDKCNKVQSDQVKLQLWQAWSRHNDRVHGAKSVSIYAYLQFLLNMEELILQDHDEAGAMVAKGKGKKPLRITGDRPGQPAHGRREGGISEATREGWRKPTEGWIKVNVDGSYGDQTGDAGVGIIARDQEGSVIFTAWRVLFDCTSAKEAEARACVEGLRVAAQWCHEPVLLESDSAQIVGALWAEVKDRSELCFLIAEARESCDAPGISKALIHN
ncbi:hypothetical protein BS78_02G207100 [Paspalum vaginatum]|nr:hypothetical protein BS78_02G207100 [Paspalum vaginatum]